MKVTIIATKPDGGHQQELLKAGQDLGLDVSIRDITSADIQSGKVSKMLGDAVIWRSSALNIRTERPGLLNVMKNKIVASDAVFTYPTIYHKYFQQTMLKTTPSLAKWAMPTFKVRTKAALRQLIAEGQLAFPVIAKPNAGRLGKGITLLSDDKAIDGLSGLGDLVFQNFVANDGDWRVIVVGGAVVGVMKRIAKKGSFLNNISQGATAVPEEDSEVLYETRKIATKVASAFRLEVCGVDIIRDQATGEFKVLEVNTAPQWRGEFGFAQIMGIDVARVIMEWVKERGEAKQGVLADHIDTYYKKRVRVYPNEYTHFALRSWLWSRDEWSREALDELQEEFVGRDDKAIQATVDRIFARTSRVSAGVNHKQAHRKDSFDRYPQLSVYNALLFRTIFCDTAYGIDLRPFIAKHVSDKEFMRLFNDLVADKDTIRLLSTHAVNYFYLLKNYFKNSLSKSSTVLIDPHELLELLPGYDTLQAEGVIDSKTSLKLKIYLLTHAIIGKSRFYAQPVKLRGYLRLCKEIETLIQDNFFEVSLDNKLEFLVCSELCGYETPLRSVIESEARQSVSWAGTFLVDTYNAFAGEPSKHCLRTSEHRNVLYLMSQQPFAGRVVLPAKKPLRAKRVIGRLARVSLPDYNMTRLVARVDSGATRSSINASDIQVKADGLHFKLMTPDHYLYTGKEFVVRDYRSIAVKTTSAAENERYAVELPVMVGDRTEKVLFTLSDRSHMLYPVLLGRNFLTNKYRVDTGRQFVSTVKVSSKTKK